MAVITVVPPSFIALDQDITRGDTGMIVTIAALIIAGMIIIAGLRSGLMKDPVVVLW